MTCDLIGFYNFNPFDLSAPYPQQMKTRILPACLQAGYRLFAPDGTYRSRASVRQPTISLTLFMIDKTADVVHEV